MGVPVTGRKGVLAGGVVVGLTLCGLASPALAENAGGQALAEPHGLFDDAFDALDLPSGGLLTAAGASAIPGYYQTSEYMAGSVAVGIVLVESDGRVDPSSEDWTAEERRQVVSEITAALDWWAALEPQAHLRFVYDDHFSIPLPTGVEPITRPYSDQQFWIADAMGALGYDAPLYFSRVRDYVNDLRAIYRTDWAFAIFVVDSSADRDNRFRDGYFAYAYLGGPFMVLTYGNNGYGPDHLDAVAAHEVGHIFHALDQYSSAQKPCTLRSGYLGVENQNSQYGGCISDVASIMRSGIAPYTSAALDPYAAGQIGWRDGDGDGILDPLDTELRLALETLEVGGDGAYASGAVEVIPYPSPSRTAVTINDVAAVQYRLDGGEWLPASSADGAFDEAAEAYHFFAPLSPGRHALEIAAVDSAGNVSSPLLIDPLVLLDPVDGGLNTELHRTEDALPAGGVYFLEGVAYHLQDGLVAGVQYRVDGGAWLSLEASDGAFDSGYEPFGLPLGSLEVGSHLVEARAVDAGGAVEVHFASSELVVVEMHAVFLPLVQR